MGHPLFSPSNDAFCDDYASSYARGYIICASVYASSYANQPGYASQLRQQDRHLSRHRHRKRPDSVPHRCQISFSLRLDNLPAAEPLSSSPTVRFAAAFCDFPLLPLGLAVSGCPVGPQQPTTTSAPAQSHRHLLLRPRLQHPTSASAQWHRHLRIRHRHLPNRISTCVRDLGSASDIGTCFYNLELGVSIRHRHLSQHRHLLLRPRTRHQHPTLTPAVAPASAPR